VLLLVDGRAGLTAIDEDIAGQLRRAGKPVHLVINKAEHRDPDLLSADFHALGLDHLHVIAAAHNQGVETLMEEVFAALPATGEKAEGEATGSQEPERVIKLAVVGRPNVGKSTLVNRLLGEERMLACDMPGTTRDSVAVPFERDGQRYILVDTAGVRRRSRVGETVGLARRWRNSASSKRCKPSNNPMSRCWCWMRAKVSAIRTPACWA